jgi:zinc transporter 1/2/3
MIFFIENILFSHSHSLDDEEDLKLATNPLINNDEEGVITSSNTEDDMDKTKIVPAAILSGALVVHSTFEGIALGLLKSKTSTVTLCTAVLIHNIPAAIALGIKMKGIRKWVYSILMAAFVLSSPVSIMIGIFLSDLGYPGIEGVFLSISAGTFIYIGCTEILPEEMHNEGSKVSKFIAFCFGLVPLGIFLLFISE